MATPKRGLGSKGKGMGAVIDTELSTLNTKGTQLPTDKPMEIDINKIEPNRKQPRHIFDETALEELAASIKEYGIVQPLIVNKNEDYYEIVAGERRWRAAKIAGLKEVPVIIRDYESDRAFEIALVENIQREDLNPMEEAESYKRLTEEFGLSQDKVAEKVGKSRSAVTNALRLFNLDPRVQNFVVEGKLSAGHARALLGVTDGEEQFELAERILEDGLSVRNTESIVKHMAEKVKKDNMKEEKSSIFDVASYKTIENDLKGILGTKVKLSSQKNKGKIEIEYYSNQDLDRLFSILKSVK